MDGKALGIMKNCTQSVSPQTVTGVCSIQNYDEKETDENKTQVDACMKHLVDKYTSSFQ